MSITASVPDPRRRARERLETLQQQRAATIRAAILAHPALSDRAIAKLLDLRLWSKVKQERAAMQAERPPNPFGSGEAAHLVRVLRTNPGMPPLLASQLRRMLLRKGARAYGIQVTGASHE